MLRKYIFKGCFVRLWAKPKQMRGQNWHTHQIATQHTHTRTHTVSLSFQIWWAAGRDYPVSTGLKAWFSSWCHCSRIQDGCMAAWRCALLRAAALSSWIMTTEAQKCPAELWNGSLRLKFTHTHRFTFYGMWVMAVIACVTSSVLGHFQQPLMNRLDSKATKKRKEQGQKEKQSPAW